MEFNSQTNIKRALPFVPFAFALSVYAATRLIALDQFPIYFFTDEAIHPVLGIELVSRGWRDHLGNFLPPYFQNGQYWNLSFSVYIHAISAALFGKSIFIPRATSSLISVLAAAAVALLGKTILKLETWWLAVLTLAVTPAWFLHSRTAFETALMVSFYAIFLLFYLLYRYRSPSFLFLALGFGAATFYSYANGQSVMLVTGVLLLFSDLGYHLKNWRVAALGGALLVLLALPYARFRLEHPEELEYHLRVLNSYWLQPLPISDKISQFVWNYADGLSPQYWFFPNDQDLARHLMKGYGHLALWMLPLLLIGVVVCLLNIDSSAHRAILIAALAAPFGAALASIGITRVLAFVIPANLFVLLGWEALICSRWLNSARYVFGGAAFFALGITSFAMLGDAVSNGPLWYNNYGLYGMQWGTKQIFSEIVPDYLRANPQGVVYVTPVWANGADIFPRFFSLDPERVELRNVDWFLEEKRPIDPNVILLATPEELQLAASSPKLKNIISAPAIQYPDGRNGFYFVRLAYADKADQLFAADMMSRARLSTDTVTLQGQSVDIVHSQFDAGQMQDLFDGDPYTLVRGASANPLIIEMHFASPRAIQTVSLTVGSMNFRLTVSAYGDEGDGSQVYRAQYVGLPSDPTILTDLTLGPRQVSRVRLEILSLDAGEPAKIHVRELRWK